MLCKDAKMNYDDTKQLYDLLKKEDTDFYSIYHDRVYGIIDQSDFADLYSPDMGRPSVDPVLVVNALLLQACMNWTDRETVDNICMRVDVKIALHLPLYHKGFDDSLLSIYRARLMQSEKHKLLLQKQLDKLFELGLLNPKLQRTDSTHILARGRKMKRYETVGAGIQLLTKASAQEIDANDPLAETLQQLHKKYKKIKGSFKETEEQMDKKLVNALKDAINLIEKLKEKSEINKLQEFQLLKKIISEQIQEDSNEGDNEQSVSQDNSTEEHSNVNNSGDNSEVDSPEKGCAICLDKQPPAQKPDTTHDKRNTVVETTELNPTPKKTSDLKNTIVNPRDSEMRSGKKNSTHWFGGKLQISESIPDEDKEGLPSIITSIVVTPANEPDQNAYAQILDSRPKKLKPSKEYVDAGYLSGKNIFLAEQQKTELLGVATTKDTGLYRIEQFKFDDQNKVAICPAGKTSNPYWEFFDKAADMIRREYKFKVGDCRSCSHKQRCTTAKSRSVIISQYYHYIQKIRQMSTDKKWARKTRRTRAGIEATISMIVSNGWRRSKVFGLVKTNFIYTIRAIAINIKKMSSYILKNAKKLMKENSAASDKTMKNVEIAMAL